jgi:hypothetical protein
LRFYLGLDRRLLGVVTNGQTDLPACAAHDAQHRGPIMGQRPFAGALIGAVAGWVGWISMFPALFAGILEQHTITTRFTENPR